MIDNDITTYVIIDWNKIFINQHRFGCELKISFNSFLRISCEIVHMPRRKNTLSEITDDSRRLQLFDTYHHSPKQPSQFIVQIFSPSIPLC